MSPLAGVLALALSLPTPQRFAAEVEDSYALRVNPAGLAFLRGHELRMVYGYDAVGLETHGVGIFGALRLSNMFTLGAAWERDFGTLDSGALRLGAGIGGGPFAFGVAYARVDTLGPQDVDRWDLGVASRIGRWIAAGVRFGDLGEELSRRTYDLSVALRPGTDRVTVSTRWRLTEDESLNAETLDLGVRAEVEIVPGFSLGAGVDTDLNLFGQLSLDLGSASEGGFFGYVDERVQAGAEIVYRSVPAHHVFAPSRVAVVGLSGELVSEPELELLRGAYRVEPYGRAERTLRALSESDRVEGVLVRLGNLSIGWAKAEGLRRSLARLREAGLRVDCHLPGAGDIEYYVASACTQILALPGAVFDVNGLASVRLYYGEALARFGISVEVERVGAYKNGPDAYARSDMSDEERERIEAWQAEVYGTHVAAVAAGRHLEVQAVEAALARGVLTASVAQALGLIDAQIYPDELEGKLRQAYGRWLRFGSAPAPDPAPYPRPWQGRPQLGIVHVDAPISGGVSQTSPLGLGRSVGAQTLIRALEAARRNRRIRAVVLRVDSPGGDALASDLVARAVARVAEVKPVVASLGDIAASGGYYVAAPARAIVAESTTLTGSIGIYSTKLDLSKLLERLGVGVEVIQRGPRAADSLPWQTRPEAGDRAVAAALRSSYDRFLAVVAAGRGLRPEEVDAVARGRIWSGRAALDVGLVDALGGFDEAVTRAARMAGVDVETLELVTLNETHQPIADPLQALLSSVVGAVFPGVRSFHAWLPPALLRFGASLELAATGRPMALLPFAVEIE